MILDNNTRTKFHSTRSKACILLSLVAIILYLEYYLRLRGPRVSNHLEIRRSVVGGERKEPLFLSPDLFILVRDAPCVNFYGNAAWFTTQYLEEISRRRKIEGGMITFPPFFFFFISTRHPLLGLLLVSSQITFFSFSSTLEINDPTLMKFVPPPRNPRKNYYFELERVMKSFTICIYAMKF